MSSIHPQPSLARRALADVPNILALAAFMGITALAFRSWEFALIVGASLGFHELGHAAALSLSGLRWRISFNILGAYTWSSRAEREQLSGLRNTFIHLAGPIFSLLLALMALLLQYFWGPADEHLRLLANFSAQVGLFNLLPFGSLTDGGKVVKRLAESSLRGAARAWATALPLVISAVMLAAYLLTQAGIGGSGTASVLISLLLLGVWMTGSLLLEMRPLFLPRLEEPRLLQPPRPQAPPLSQPAQLMVAIPVTGRQAAPRLGLPITAAQGGLVLSLMWGLLILALVISAATPFWLAPRYLLGGLINVANLLMFFSGRGIL